MYRIVENSYGDLGERFDTYEEAQAFLDADDWYESGDMSIWIEECE